MEDDFYQYLEGLNYAPKTIPGYIGALRNAYGLLQMKVENSILEISSVKDFIDIKTRMLSSNNFEEVNRRGHGRLKAALEAYQKFLEEQEKNCSISIISSGDSQKTNSSGKSIPFPRNRIFFGAPGTGKSYQLNEDAKGFDNNIERVTFYPTYSYAQFVGTYKPVMRKRTKFLLREEDFAILRVLQDKTLSLQEKYDKLYPEFKNLGHLTRLPILLGICAEGGEVLLARKKDGSSAKNEVEFQHGKALQRFVKFVNEENTEERIAYKYVPGPFIRTWIKAKQNPDQNYLLIIEELNRANAAAVFGDLFQLLDRKSDGESEYPVTTSEDLRDYLEDLLGEEVINITIPSNLYIWATMNSADQGVQPLDTAFKRRWDYTYMDIDSKEEEINKIRFTVAGKTYKWNDLRKEINRLLLAKKVNEDKLIGPFYLKTETLNEDDFVEQFCDKILMYLFEDAARQRRDFFDSEQLRIGGKVLPETYSNYCKAFEKCGPAIFKGIDLKEIVEPEESDKVSSDEEAQSLEVQSGQENSVETATFSPEEVPQETPVEDDNVPGKETSAISQAGDAQDTSPEQKKQDNIEESEEQ